MSTAEGNLKILFLEGQPHDVELVRRELKLAKITITAKVIDDLKELERELQTFVPDIVLSEFRIGDFTCLEALQLIKEHRPSTPMIIVGGLEDEELVARCIESGAAACINKNHLEGLVPTMFRALLTTVRFTSLAVDSGSDAAFWIAPDGRFLYVNRKATRSLGYSREELLGMKVSDIDPEMPAERWPAHWKELRRRKHMVFESIHQTKDGRRYPVEISIDHQEIDGQEYNFAFARDITDRSLSEEALLKSEANLKRAQAIARVGSWAIDLDSQRVYASDEARRIYGVESHDLTIQQVQKMPLPEYRATLDEALENAASHGGQYDVEFKIRRPADGAIVDVHSIAEYDAKKNMVVGTIQDVTEFKRAANALQETEERYRLLFQRNLAGVYRTTTDGQFLDCNDALASILGYATREEALQLDAKDLYCDSSEREKFLAAIRDTNEVRNYEVKLRRRDGTPCWCLLNSILMRGQAGEPSTMEGTLIDITDRKEMEKRLLHAQKMETVGILAGGVAHKFNNLLQAILGLAHGLRRGYAVGQDVHRSIDELEGLVQRGHQLTRQLLVFSSKDTAETSVLDLNEVVSATCRLLQDSLPETIDMALDLCDSVLPVQADPGQLEQVVMNLATNALEAMPDGGRLVIRSGRENVEWLFLEIKDSGRGIADHVRDRIFEPFFTTKTADYGSGLGLSVVHGTVSRCGGRVEVKSEVGVGTTIRVVLPVHLAASPSDDLAAESSKAPKRIAPAAETILVVEDERLVREGVREMLTAMGYEVETADSVAQAEKALSAFPVRLLLTDMILPDGSGAELIEKTRSVDPSLPIIVMTGYSPESLDLGRIDVPILLKPFSVAKLAQTVRAALVDVSPSDSR